MLGIKIDKLRNLGPRSQQMLATAGIMTEKQLRALGSGHAFLAVKRAGCTPSLNLLWAIEGALTDRDWKEVAKRIASPCLLTLKCWKSSRREQVRDIQCRVEFTDGQLC